MQIIKNLFFKFLELLKHFFSSGKLLTNSFISDHFKIFLIVSASIFLIAFIIKILTSWKFRKNPIYLKLSNMIFSMLLTISLISGFLLFSIWQGIGIFSYIFWWYLIGLTFLIWGCIICIYRVKKFPEELENYINSKNREKYLPRRKPGLPKSRRRKN